MLLKTSKLNLSQKVDTANNIFFDKTLGTLQIWSGMPCLHQYNLSTDSSASKKFGQQKRASVTVIPLYECLT